MAYWGEVEIVQNYQNISGNYTNVSIYYYACTDTGSSWSNNKTYPYVGLYSSTLTLEETQTLASFNFGNNKRILVASLTRDIPHNSDGTMSVGASFSWNSNHSNIGTITGSNEITLTTIPRYANFTEHYIVSTGLTSITVKWNADANCDAVEYSLNGANWETASGLTYTITKDVSHNTNYNIRTRIKRADSQLWTTSGYIYATTKDIARVTYGINFNSDSNAYMEFSNPSGATVNLRIEVSEGAIYRSNITGTYNGVQTFYLTDAERKILYDSCPTSNYLTVKYVVATVVNGKEEYWHTLDKTMTVVNSNPIFSNFEYKDSGTLSTQYTGDNQTIINGWNSFDAIVSTANKAQAINGAKMVKYRLVCGNQSTEMKYSDNSDVLLELAHITNMTFTVYAIDGRGNSTAVTKSASIWKDYFNRSIISGSAIRTEQVNKEVRLTFSGKFWNDNFGAKPNEITECKYEYKKTTDTEYTTGTTVITPTISGNTFSASLLIKGDAGAEGFEISNSYNIRVSVSDAIPWGSVTYDILLSAGKPGLAIHRDGASAGAPYDESVGGALQIDGHRSMCEDMCKAYFYNGQTTISYNTAWELQKIPLNVGETIGNLFTFDWDNKRIIVNKDGYVDVEACLNIYLDGYIANSDYILDIMKNGVATMVAYEHCNSEELYKKLQGFNRGISVKKGDYFELGVVCSQVGTLRSFEGPGTSLTLTYRRI